uniref:Non-haem dioxygenase N-terminal domain-containing protein n=1 Tax=Leersia perrieri TaxID=77586 RepID=A0A0D9X314_9ORYZ
MAAVQVFDDAAILSKQEAIPSQFIWPADEAPGAAAFAVEEIAIPVVDLAEFMASGGGGGIGRDVVEACERHGFFQVVNHGVGEALIAEAYRCCDEFFYARPMEEKQRARRRAGENHRYASSFTAAAGTSTRFECKLPWKETLSFNCRAVHDYFVSVLGDDYRHMGRHASCIHRVVVNDAVTRRSLAFFLNPQLDRVVSPPPALIGPRAFPDFTCRRSDTKTMDAFHSSGHNDCTLIYHLGKWSV